MPWTEAQDATLRELATYTHLAGAAREMGISVDRVWARAYHKKIRGLPLKTANEPTEGEWLGIAAEVAREAGLSRSALIGPRCDRLAVRARWMAWRRLLEEYPQYSRAGLARVCGWDHTTIRYGLKRLAEIEVQNA